MKIKLGLLTGIDMVLITEKSMRGRINNYHILSIEA